jgi:hypothetical protein
VLPKLLGVVKEARRAPAAGNEKRAGYLDNPDLRAKARKSSESTALLPIDRKQA